MGLFPDDNYLFAEAAILARLREAFPDGSGVTVGSVGTVDELTGGSTAFPSVHVGYLGDTPATAAGSAPDPAASASLGGGRAAQVVQHWAVVAAAKDAASPRTSSAARAEAGRLTLRVLKALQGFEAAPGRRLVRAPLQGPTAIYMTGGHVFLAAQFNLTLDVIGD